MASRFIPQLARAILRNPIRSNQVAVRSFLSVTSPKFEKKTMQVPSMGDSITEGTIVEWTAEVGQMVREGDVVALVETDKVTVDIKADIDGVVTQRFGDVDDTVEVGANLYELDTEAEATVHGTDSPFASSSGSATELAAEAPSPATAKASPPAAAPSPAKQTQHERMPSIKFLGKEGWSLALNGAPELPPLPSNYGRPVFSEEEMEALMMGGANLVPEVQQHSSGAVFGY